MQRYIKQLIEDIHKSTWNLKPPHNIWEESGADPNNELELEDISYVEQYIEGEEQPIAIITGIDPEQLPPPERLTTEQQELLASELENLLQCHHFFLDFPDNYPVHLRYPFIRDFWNEKHVPLSFGENHIEFCDYDEIFCPFPGYCNTCKEIEIQMKHDEETGGKADLQDFKLEDLLMSPEELEEFYRRKDNWPVSDEEDDEDDIPPDNDMPF